MTLLVVVIESLLSILSPLLIGLAINDLLEDSYQGIYTLAAMGAVSLLIGSLRRFYDTRVYSGIYRTIAGDMVDSEQRKGSNVSAISARTGLINEFVEFMENSMPEVVGAFVGLVGILVIIAGLNLQVFLACLALLVLILVTYSLTGRLNYRLNAGYNDQLERQVAELQSGKRQRIAAHFKQLMHWNIKLSDLETLNYFVIFVGVIALLLFTPITVIDSGVLKYGLIFAILMYVFDYTENLLGMPIYIQQLIRLKEISQ
ncbi:MAG: ABC transporter six-transmembrane domain-containing protein, partial [Pseudomonadota bacterium]|nr:ABC transporter six-transmembrane domain-containing protein [Pseudomonadota bacterium]